MARCLRIRDTYGKGQRHTDYWWEEAVQRDESLDSPSRTRIHYITGKDTQQIHVLMLMLARRRDS
jgi:hypothetical protein